MNDKIDKMNVKMHDNIERMTNDEIEKFNDKIEKMENDKIEKIKKDSEPWTERMNSNILERDKQILYISISTTAFIIKFYSPNDNCIEIILFTFAIFSFILCMYFSLQNYEKRIKYCLFVLELMDGGNILTPDLKTNYKKYSNQITKNMKHTHISFGLGVITSLALVFVKLFIN